MEVTKTKAGIAATVVAALGIAGGTQLAPKAKTTIPSVLEKYVEHNDSGTVTTMKIKESIKVRGKDGKVQFIEAGSTIEVGE